MFLSGRVREPDESDWKKLVKFLVFLHSTIEDILALECDDIQVLKWYLDAAFAVHFDMRSHTGGTFTLGKGAVISESTKQKANTRSSTEAESNTIDDKIAKVICAYRFIRAQGFKVYRNG